MSGFLGEMGRLGAERVARAKARRSTAELSRIAAERPSPPPLLLSKEGFDLIAEVKFASPVSGALAAAPPSAEAAIDRGRSYAASGAAAISVLTEPLRFHGDLSFLTAVADEVSIPVLRKDFLVDPYQILESRAAGAAGVLLIAQLLPGALLRTMIDAAHDAGLLVLLELADEADVDRAVRFAEPAPGTPPRVLLGVNARDLGTLAIDRGRLARLARRLPPGGPHVAESGMRGKEDVEEAARLGYRVALAGTLLMRSADPREVVRDLIAAGRKSRAVAVAR